MAGVVAGLAASPLGHAGLPGAAAAIVVATGVAALGLTRPRGTASCPAAVAWLASAAVLAVLAGASVGAARIAAIDAGALRPPPGTELRVAGVVVTPPRVGSEATRFVVEAGGGRIGVEAVSTPAGLVQGAGVAVRGTARELEAWELGLWQQDGARAVVVADSVRETASVRTGFAGALDGIRNRAREALGQGTGEPSAALLRGFVLGEDDRIAEPVREEFRRSGLAHVLAVSGQNVMLLALLAMPLLAVAGVGLRARLVVVIALIAVYVPVAGGGASIQRAGVMGAAGIVALLAGRSRSGWYALGLAAAVTLAIDPRATGDIGWQLSFAAVTGLFALGGPLARALGASDAAGQARRLFAEGAAITIAASVATGPLVAHHFGAVSLTALPANLVALPAIAPAMWLGMLASALGQLPGAPVEALTWLGGLCAGYVGGVARAFGPEWAQLDVPAPGPAATAALTLGLFAAVRVACAQRTRRSGLVPRGPRALAQPLRATALGAGALATVAVLWALHGGSGPAPAPPLEVRVLDVGQGDAILVRAAGEQPLLIDTGPPGAALPRLRELGVERLGAIVITHDQLDHSGALSEVARALPVDRVLVGPGSAPRACGASATCPGLRRLTAGDSLRAGPLRVEVLWPRSPAPAGADPNASSLVLALRFGRFDALLTGDAEAELAPYRVPQVEMLKVAHHGSADAGLPRLLQQADPTVAAISAGVDNPYGHPAPQTLADLAAARVPALRTDVVGDVVITVDGDGWSVG